MAERCSDFEELVECGGAVLFLECMLTVGCPVHLAGGRLSGEVGQGWCKCHMIRDKPLIVASQGKGCTNLSSVCCRDSKSFNSPYFALCGSHLIIIHRMTQVNALLHTKLVLSWLAFEAIVAQLLQHLLEVMTMCFPYLTVHHRVIKAGRSELVSP